MGREILGSLSGFLTKNGRLEKKRVRYLVVYCSDPFYHPTFEEFVNGLGEACVVFAEPGGPLLLQHEWCEPQKEEETILGRVRFIIDELGVEEIILINHSECAAYRDTYGGEGVSQEQIDGYAKADLEDLVPKLSERFPKVKKVYAFFAHPEGGYVRFSRI